MIGISDNIILEENLIQPSIQDQILRISSKTLHVPIVNYKWNSKSWCNNTSSGELCLSGMELNAIGELNLLMKDKLILAFLNWNFLDIPKEKRVLRLEKKKSKYAWAMNFAGVSEIEAINNEDNSDFTFLRYFPDQALKEGFDLFSAIVTNEFIKENCARGILDYTKETGQEVSITRVINQYYNSARIQSILTKFERIIGI